MRTVNVSRWILRIIKIIIKGHYKKAVLYGAPFVTSRILLTEYNSVGQNTILSNRIQFCRTELHSVDKKVILSNRIRILLTELYSVDRIILYSVQQNSYSVGQNYILSTECNSVRQNCILLDRIVFCPTEL